MIIESAIEATLIRVLITSIGPTAPAGMSQTDYDNISDRLRVASSSYFNRYDRDSQVK